jgi:PTS system nitrogen regulatory IIA component
MAASFLWQILKPDLIRMSLKSRTKPEIIRELVGILDAAGLLKDRTEAENVVLAREGMMSTGMENGVAIPHGKTDTVDGLLVAMALCPEGVEFDCIDRKPAHILIITLSPASRTGPHIRFMAEISRILRDADLREQVLKAMTPEAVVDIMLKAEKPR